MEWRLGCGSSSSTKKVEALTLFSVTGIWQCGWYSYSHTHYRRGSTVFKECSNWNARAGWKYGWKMQCLILAVPVLSYSSLLTTTSLPGRCYCWKNGWLSRLHFRFWILDITIQRSTPSAINAGDILGVVDILYYRWWALASSVTQTGIVFIMTIPNFKRCVFRRYSGQIALWSHRFHSAP